MLIGAALRQSGNGWQFASESALEDFVWNNLHSILEMTPIARQYSAKGELCDIIAVDSAQRLTTIELKNIEDRYIVQQLTRYYDNLLEIKPFLDPIDYNQPIRLIAIAPSYHRHNYIDRKYNQLNIEFFTFTIIAKNQDFYLQLINVDTNLVTQLKIPYQKFDSTTSSSNVPEPPQILLDWLGSCNPEEQQAILKMREKILAFDDRISEEIQGKRIIRYLGKSNLIAEICVTPKINKPVLFMWLPIPSSLFGIKKEVIGRLRLWLDEANIAHLAHIPKGMGKMKLQSEWDAMPREKRPNLLHSLTYKSLIPVPINWYKNLRDTYKISDSLEFFTDLALTKWLAKI